MPFRMIGEHYNYIKMLTDVIVSIRKELGIPANLQLIGHTGTGKTKFVNMYAKVNNMNLVPIYLWGDTTVQDVLEPVQIEIREGKPIMTVVPVYKKLVDTGDMPAIMYLNELNRSSPIADGGILELLSENTYTTRNNETVKLNSIAIITINPASSDPSVRELSTAIKSRITVSYPYLMEVKPEDLVEITKHFAETVMSGEYEEPDKEYFSYKPLTKDEIKEGIRIVMEKYLDTIIDVWHELKLQAEEPTSRIVSYPDVRSVENAVIVMGAVWKYIEKYENREPTLDDMARAFSLTFGHMIETTDNSLLYPYRLAENLFKELHKAREQKTKAPSEAEIEEEGQPQTPPPQVPVPFH